MTARRAPPLPDVAPGSPRRSHRAVLRAVSLPAATFPRVGFWDWSVRAASPPPGASPGRARRLSPYVMPGWSLRAVPCAHRSSPAAIHGGHRESSRGGPGASSQQSRWGRVGGNFGGRSSGSREGARGACRPSPLREPRRARIPAASPSWARAGGERELRANPPRRLEAASPVCGCSGWRTLERDRQTRAISAGHREARSGRERTNSQGRQRRRQRGKQKQKTKLAAAPWPFNQVR